MRGRKASLSFAEEQAAKRLTYRQAPGLYHIGYTRWCQLRAGCGFLPFHQAEPGDEEADLEARLLASVKEKPHLNVQQRAREVGCGSAPAQRILHSRGLNKLNKRLEYAGYKVETCRPLRVARMRRIVATYPGSLTQLDYKTFGFLRRSRGEQSERLGGFVSVDSLTAFGSAKLASTDSGEEAAKALEKYADNAPFQPKGLLLTDNAKCFLSDVFIATAANMGLIQRTIKTGHPWSNGEVEALNRTLKYQCFPAIAGNISSWQQAVDLVGTWMDYYNATRAHGGHINRGPPPLVFHALYEQTPGTHIEKLLKLGIIKLDGEWRIRLMGDSSSMFGKATKTGLPPVARDDFPLLNGVEGDPLPFALVLDRIKSPVFSQAMGDHQHVLTEPPKPDTEGGLVLQK